MRGISPCTMNSLLIVISVCIVAFIVATFELVKEKGDRTDRDIDENAFQYVFNLNQMTVYLGSNSSLQLILHDGTNLSCNIAATKDGWYGEQCGGNARDANIILHKDHNGIHKIFGSIRVGTNICSIKPNAAGVEEIACIPEIDIPPVGDPIIPSSNSSEEYDAHVRNLHVGFDASHLIDGATDDHGRLLYDDSGSNIDVMVVWTNDAECKNSGLPVGCRLTATTESNMRGVIDLLVAETNAAFTLSGMHSSLRLVHAYRDPSYIEPPNADPNGPNEPLLVAIRDLVGTTDGKLDGVHAMRALYGADMVQLIVGQLSYCGRGYLSTQREFAFSVISSSCTIGGSTYAHEIGHNFEMKHDRGTEGSCDATGYNFGYRSPTASFRTIMAYDCQVGQCDNMPKNGCINTLRFSNTQYRYNGEPLGNAKHNNALQFNNFRAIVASNFPAMNCRSNGQCNDKNPNTIDACNFAKAVCVFTPGRTPRSVASPSAPRPIRSPIAPRPVKLPSPIAPRPVKLPSPVAPRPVPSPIAPVPIPVPISVPSTVAPVPIPVPIPVPSPIAPVPIPVPIPVPSPIAPVPIPVPSPNVPLPIPVPSPSPPVPIPVPSPVAPVPIPGPSPIDPVPIPVPSPNAPVPIPVPSPIDPVPIPVPSPIDPATIPVPSPIAPVPIPVPSPISR